MTTPTFSVYEFSALLATEDPPKDTYCERHFTARILSPDVEQALAAFIALIPDSLPTRKYDWQKSQWFEQPERVKVTGRSVRRCRTMAEGVTRV